MKIQPVVEGHGEVEAVPVLLRRLLHDAQIWTVGVGRPIRRSRSQLATQKGITQAMELARAQPECGGILVLFDGDDDCPAKLGPQVQTWATESSLGTPCAVCMAHREYEAWFLATADSLRGHKAMKADAEPHPKPESKRNAKSQLELLMLGAYKETMHQAAFSSKFSLKDAFDKCRSFKKLVTSVRTLIYDMGQEPEESPP